MNIELLYSVAFDALRFAVLPLMYWLWQQDRRVSRLENKMAGFDIVKLSTTLVKIEKDLESISADVAHLRSEQQRQRDYLNQP